MKPMLFNTEMVRAILEGKKTETRRLMKPQPTDKWCHDTQENRNVLACAAKFHKGDVLYVRETWNYGYVETTDMPGRYDVWFEEVRQSGGDFIRAISSYFYKASDEANLKGVDMIWRPSIHMPKEAARLFLRVTDVRAERLQEITDAGIHAEGIDEPQSRERFAALWDSKDSVTVRELYGWEKNPWLWVYSFERITKEEAWET